MCVPCVGPQTVKFECLSQITVGEGDRKSPFVCTVFASIELEVWFIILLLKWQSISSVWIVASELAMSDLLCFWYVNDFYLSASPDWISEKCSVRYLQGAVLLHSCPEATERQTSHGWLPPHHSRAVLHFPIQQTFFYSSHFVRGNDSCINYCVIIFISDKN